MVFRSFGLTHSCGSRVLAREASNAREQADMTTPKPSKPDDPAQSQRFIDMAREVGVDETPGAFELAFKKVIRPNAKVASTSEPSHESRQTEGSGKRKPRPG